MQVKMSMYVVNIILIGIEDSKNTHKTKRIAFIVPCSIDTQHAFYHEQKCDASSNMRYTYTTNPDRSVLITISTLRPPLRKTMTCISCVINTMVASMSHQQPRHSLLSSFLSGEGERVFYNKNPCAWLLWHWSSLGQLALCNPRGR